MYSGKCRMAQSERPPIRISSPECPPTNVSLPPSRAGAACSQAPAGGAPPYSAAETALPVRFMASASSLRPRYRLKQQARRMKVNGKAAVIVPA